MPITVVCDQCDSRYSLKDEMAGQKVRCKKCNQVLVAPLLDEPEDDFDDVDRGYHPAFARDKFLVNQKRLSISQKYYVYDERGNPIMFIERPVYFFRTLLAIFAVIFIIIGGVVATGALAIALGGPGGNNAMSGIVFVVGLITSIVLGVAVAIWLSPKRHVSIYTDDTRQHKLLEVLQDHKLNIIRASFSVQDPEHGHLGRFEKNYLWNMLRRRWYVYGADGELHMLAMEDSLIMSLMRRVLPPIIAIFIARTNFVMHLADDPKTLGEFNRKLTLFDKYVLDMSHDRDHAIDRRVAVALGVMLDTGERR